MEDGKKKRLVLLDALTGVNFISMLLYHAMYDIVWIFDRGGSYPLYKGTPGFVWQQIIAITFIVISGFSTHLGKKSPKRGITVSLCGAAVTVATAVFYPSETIKYGILTFMGFSMIAVFLLNNLLEKINPYVGMLVSVIMFVLFRNIDMGYIGLGGVRLYLSETLYGTRMLAGLGFPYKGFSSSDYFPFLPWFFVFLFGYYLAIPLLKCNRITEFMSRHGGGVFTFIGRNTLVLYMLHQPIVFAVLYVWFSAFAS